MKRPIKSTILALSVFIVFTAAKPVQENKLCGTWKLASCVLDGKPVPKGMMDRTLTFNPDLSFGSLIKVQDANRPYITGKYFLPNDSTVVTLHSDWAGKFAKTAFTYNFRTGNDSLHLYGEYLIPVPSVPSIMKKVYMDEWWVKEPALPVLAK